MTASTSLVPNDLLLHPSTYDRPEFDATTRRLLGATVDWFEARGKNRLLADYHDKIFYSDFLDFAAKEGLFATFLTPPATVVATLTSAGIPVVSPRCPRSSASTDSTTGTRGR